MFHSVLKSRDNKSTAHSSNSSISCVIFACPMHSSSWSVALLT